MPTRETFVFKARVASMDVRQRSLRRTSALWLTRSLYLAINFKKIDRMCESVDKSHQNIITHEHIFKCSPVYDNFCFLKNIHIFCPTYLSYEHFHFYFLSTIIQQNSCQHIRTFHIGVKYCAVPFNIFLKYQHGFIWFKTLMYVAGYDRFQVHLFQRNGDYKWDFSILTYMECQHMQ